MRGVVFPGKEFMISKYIENKEPRAKNQDDRKDTSSHQNFGGCGIHIVGGLPCGRW